MQLRFGRKRFDEENAFSASGAATPSPALRCGCSTGPGLFRALRRGWFISVKTTSNIPAFYGKSSNQLMLSFSKEF